jgi:hypothetical protein
VRIFYSLAELASATASGAFYFKPEYGPAGFVCNDCRELHPLNCYGNGCGTGYGYDKENRMFCYACGGNRTRADMMREGRADLYLSGNIGDEKRVTDWTSHLSFPILGRRCSRYGGGFDAQRTDAWFVGPDGFVWHAVNRGDMQLARCRRTRSTLERDSNGWYRIVKPRRARKGAQS